METQTESLRQAEISAPTTSSSADQSGPEAALESTLVDNLEEKAATLDNLKEEVQEREIRPQVSEPALKRYVHEFLRLHNVTFYKTDYRQLREYVEKKLCLPDGFLKPSDQHPMDFQHIRRFFDTVLLLEVASNGFPTFSTDFRHLFVNRNSIRWIFDFSNGYPTRFCG